MLSTANMIRVCFLVLVFVCAEAGAITGRGFFCRDPDSGKLHAVNTTWPSSSFCGNYHCRIRRKNLTETEYAPLRQLYVKNVNIKGDTNKTNESRDEEIMNSINEMLDSNIIDISRESSLFEPVKKTDGDRYLTDFEIKTISTLLHAVKRSDLDAILNIYKIAQDIYRDIDKTHAENLIRETVQDIKKGFTKETPKVKLNVNEIKKAEFKNGMSYWYDPISYGKQRQFAVNLSPDQNTLGSEIKKVTTTKPTTTTAQPVTNVPKLAVVPSFFSGALTTKDFRKLPYYYPISDFQRMASYYHKAGAPKFNYGQPAPKISTRPPTTALPVLLPISISKTPEIKTETPLYRNEIKPSILLPYPFSYISHNYNWTFPLESYNNGNNLEIERSNRYETGKKKDKKQVAVLMNPDLENFEDLGPVHKQEKTEKKSESKFKHDWQTDQISRQILEEVRANFADKAKFLKPYPLRKKVTLERVGKLFKIDESKNRRKREAEVVEESVPELFEVYVEKTTTIARRIGYDHGQLEDDEGRDQEVYSLQVLLSSRMTKASNNNFSCQSDDSIPGFFRYGNMSQPFPECCPQRIS